VSALVSGPEPRDGSEHAPTRRLVGAFAIAAMLLTASFAASPAWAQDAVPEVPAPAGAPAPPPPPPDPAPPPNVPTSRAGTSAPTAPRPPATPDVPPVQQHSGAGVPASGGSANHGPSPTGDAAGDRISTDDVTRTTGPSSRHHSKKAPLSAIARRNQGSRQGKSHSIGDRRGRSDRPGSAANRRHASSTPGFGNQLPNENPSSSLQSSLGGAAAGLALAGMLAVLGGVFVLPRDRSRIFRLPTATWRPSAYVPPIESPG
jgi:hypothetical protein